MADNSIVQGLFGIDPTQYMQQQANYQNTQAQDFASMSGAQQGQYGMFRGGQMAGQAAAGMMGGQDPVLAKATDLKNVLSQFDTTTPDGLKQAAAELLRRGHPEQAQMAVEHAQNMQVKQATIYQKSGENLNSLISSGKYTPESVALYGQTRDPSKLVLIDKGLTGKSLDKVAEAEQNIANLSATNIDIDTWMSKVDPKAEGGPKVTFGPLSSAGHLVSGLAGNPTDNALSQDSLRRFIAREANDILVAAKGTQTEGDAKRAYEQIMSGLDKNSNAGVYNALEDLKKAKGKTINGLETFVGTMTNKGKTPTAPSSPPSKNAIFNAVRAKKGWEDASDDEIQTAISSGKIKTK
jgi:hypothetical protein